MLVYETIQPQLEKCMTNKLKNKDVSVPVMRGPINSKIQSLKLMREHQSPEYAALIVSLFLKSMQGKEEGHLKLNS